jgi:subtilisin family serine protease
MNAIANDQASLAGSMAKGDDDQPLGKGFRPAFHALWHLKALEIVKDLTDFSHAWDGVQDQPPVRVAIIDTPIAYDHPNLEAAIERGLMRDFSVYDEGIFVLDTVDGADLEAREAISEKIRAFGKPSDAERTFLAETEGPDTRPKCRPQFYGTHGTALAGLIAARPVSTERMVPAFKGELEEAATTQTISLPYAGVNPYCKIVPISKSGSPDPGMVLATLRYAILIEAEIVVIADAWEDNAVYKKDPGAWAKVDKELFKLCSQAIVLCAAGNSGKTELAYPALLSQQEGGPIAVTACDATGKILTYAPAPDKISAMICSLSSSSENYADDVVLYDPWKKVEPCVNPPSSDPVMKNFAMIPATSLISLDVPGPYGYNPSPYAYSPPAEGPHFDIGSLYCRFSGTSAATALAAGLISLARQLEPTKEPTLKPGPNWKPDDKLFTLAKAKGI